MYPYLRSESEQKEFHEIFDVASKLFSKRKSTRQKTAETLASMGKKAVRPLMFALHCEYVSDGSDDEYQELCEEVEAILVEIGEDALPDLNDLATNEHCLIPMSDFAQETIFIIMGLEGEEKQKVCHHGMWYLCEKGEKKVWKCLFCDIEREYEEDR